MAGRGGVGGAGPGMPARPPRLPQLVRLHVRQAPRSSGGGHALPVQAGQPPVGAADPQRLHRSRHGRVYVAKVGDLRVEWSRAPPTARRRRCTAIREADGRHYVSFVVERDEPRLSRRARARWGLISGRAGSLVTSDGEIVDNPRHLRKAQRRLGRAYRALARKQRGSANRRKAVRRVAVLHRKVRETRLDAHHKLALRLVRDNQAVHLEDLSVAGWRGRNWPARSTMRAGRPWPI